MIIEGIVESMKPLPSKNGYFLFVKIRDFTTETTCLCQLSGKHPNYKNFIEIKGNQHIISNNLTSRKVRALVSNHHINERIQDGETTTYINFQITNIQDLGPPKKDE
jgi:hypothetical protein